MIGKAIYEQMLLEHQLSRAFLNRILDKMGDAEEFRKLLIMLRELGLKERWPQDLASMDREAARNIAQLRTSDLLWQARCCESCDLSL